MITEQMRPESCDDMGNALHYLQGLVAALDLIEQDSINCSLEGTTGRALSYLVGRLVVQAEELVRIHTGNK